MSQLLLMYALIFKCFCLNTDPFLTALLKWQMPSQLLSSARGSGTTPDLPTGGQCWSMQQRAWVMQSSLFAWAPECQCSTHTEYSCSVICVISAVSFVRSQRWLEALLFLVCESPLSCSQVSPLFNRHWNCCLNTFIIQQTNINLGTKASVFWWDSGWLFWLTNAHND